jgi:Tol biopolymer transport system component
MRISRRLGTLILAGALLITVEAQAAELVSQAARICSSAEASHHFAFQRSLSADGRYIAFASSGSNLVAGQESLDSENIFLRDRVTGTNVLVSHKAGAPLTAGSWISSNPAVSADGNFVVFGSQSSDLVAGQVDADGKDDLFLWERATGTTVLVSHASSSSTTAGNDWTYTYTESTLLSADARYVVFSSAATDLVAGQVDANGDPEVYLYDRLTGSNTLVSHASASAVTAANDRTSAHGISSDGRYIVLLTRATDLVPGGQAGLYYYDRVTGTHTNIAPGNVYSPAISADGNFIAFSSDESLVPGQIGQNLSEDVYLYHRPTGALTLVSHASSSPLTSANDDSGSPVLSSDGRYIVFGSHATNLVDGQNGASDYNHLFLYDRMTGTSVLVDHAHSSPATVSESAAFGQTLSADGRYVAFESVSENLVAGQNGPPSYNLFLYDRTTGLVSLASHAHTSSQTSGRLGATLPLSMSADGRWISFASTSDDLDPGDCGTERDVFLYDRQTGLVSLESRHDPAAPGLTGSSASFLLPAAAPTETQSGDGRFAVFQSTATNLLTGITDRNDSYDIFVHDRETGEVSLVSRSAASASSTANRRSTAPTISGNGRWIAFLSEATDLVPGQIDGNQVADVFLYDRAAGTMTLVSRNASSPAATGDQQSYDPNLSANGRYVAFFSRASNLVPGQVDTVFSDDVFVFDRLLGTSSLISSKAGTPAEAVGSGQAPRISDDGRYVAFHSAAQTLVAGAVYPSTGPNVFLRDRWTGTTILASRAAGPGAVTSAGFSVDPVLSTDGRFLAFYSLGVNLVAGQTDTNGQADIFVYDRLLDAMTLISHVPGAPLTTGNDGSYTPRISPEGTFVTFASWATDLVTGQTDTNAERDIFLYDRRTGELALVSHAAGSPTIAGSGPSFRSPVSADGKVAFVSLAEDLVDGQDDLSWTHDTFLYDPVSGTNRLLSGAGSSETVTGFGGGFAAGISRNGRSAYFDSAASDLVDGDYNGVNDVFADHTPTPPTDFYTLEPCRLVDTRESDPLTSDTPALLAVHGTCGIPATARALALNVTTEGGTGLGLLRFHEGGLAATDASTINFAGGTTRANNAILPLSLAERGLGVTPFVTGGGVVHLILDVVGYFE